MTILAYAIGLGAALFAIGLAGVSSDRHFIVIMLAIELILAASTIALVSFFSSSSSPGPSGVIALLSIWAVAATEVITVISFYVYIKASGTSFDVGKLNRLKW